MKTRMNHNIRRIAFGLAVLSPLNAQLSTARAQGTAFTYQGQLRNGTNAANGSYSFA